MRCIGELGLPWLRHDLDHRLGGTETEAFLRLNPKRTVPVLQDGDGPPSARPAADMSWAPATNSGRNDHALASRPLASYLFSRPPRPVSFPLLTAPRPPEPKGREG